MRYYQYGTNEICTYYHRASVVIIHRSISQTMLNVTCHAWLSWIRNFWKVSYHSMLRRVIIMITTNVFHVKFSPNNFGLHMQGRYGKCATHFLLISLQSYLTSKENWASAYFYLHYTLPSSFFRRFSGNS